MNNIRIEHCEGCGMSLSVTTHNRRISWHGPCECVESDPKEAHTVTLDTICKPLTKDKT